MANLAQPLVKEYTDETPMQERIEAARKSYQEDRSQMTSVVARKFGINELDVIRMLPAEQAIEMDASKWEEIIRSFEELDNVHVIMSNASGVLECFGKFGNFSTFGDYFNVQTKSIDMHIRGKTLQNVFAIEKPGHMDGVSTLSFQFFNDRGEAAFKVFLTFGGKKPAPERRTRWETIRDKFLKSD